MCHLQEEDLNPMIADLNSFSFVPFNFFFFLTIFVFSPFSPLTDLLLGSGANCKLLVTAKRSEGSGLLGEIILPRPLSYIIIITDLSFGIILVTIQNFSLSLRRQNKGKNSQKYTEILF